MEFQLWLLIVFTLGSSVVVGSNNLAPNQGPKQNPKPSPIVFTAESARQTQTYRPPQPPPTTAQALQPNYNEQENDGLGFVEPIDFTSFVRDLGFADGGKQSSSESKVNDYPEFFNDPPPRPSRPNNPYNYQVEEDPYRPIKSASTNNPQQQRREPESNDGFVDPNVQFRSLFDAAETDSSGFSPSDFLDYNNENSKHENTKAAQTRSYPSYTYSGRQTGGQDSRPPPSSQPPRYRSSYRQVDNRERDGGGSGGGRSNSYSGNGGPGYNGRSDSPPRRSSPRSRHNDDPQYKSNGRNKNSQQHGGSRQQTSDSPASYSSKGKSSTAPDGKKNCEKIEKEVDYDEGEGGYTGFDPADYDPATYQSRYKRQARNNNQKAKRPMTCYVCKDEQGRYAEQCEYDSTGDPNKGKDGSYFHSSSTSFTDNGNNNKPRGGRERHRRNPSTTFELHPTTTTTTTPETPNIKPEDEEIVRIPDTESLPKRIYKRQSQGNRYAPNFQAANSENENRRQYNDERDYDDDSYRDPRVPDNQERGDVEYIPPSGDKLDDVDTAENPAERDPARNLEAVFGTPPGFGKERHSNSPEFHFDFPKEFDNPDVSHSETSSNPTSDFDGFDIGYEDYVKQHFPESGGGSTRSGSSSGPTGSSAPTAPSRPSYHHRSSPASPNYDPSTPLHNPYAVNNNNPSHGRGSPPYSGGPSYGSGSNYGGSGPSSNYRGSNSHYDNSNEPYSNSNAPSYSPSSYVESSPPNYGSHGGPSQSPYPASSPSYNSHSPSYGGQSPRTSYIAYSPPTGSSSDNPQRDHTQPSHNFSPPPYDFAKLGTENIEQAISQFNQRDRKDCHKVHKGDMTCYVCRDARGMNKEECMYASNPSDPNGGQMEYHEVSEFSSDPPNNQNGVSQPHYSTQSFQIQESKVVVSKNTGRPSIHQHQATNINSEKKDGAESKTDEKKIKPVLPEKKKSGSTFHIKVSKVKEVKKSPIDYDFDY